MPTNLLNFHFTLATWFLHLALSNVFKISASAASAFLQITYCYKNVCDVEFVHNMKSETSMKQVCVDSFVSLKTIVCLFSTSLPQIYAQF